MQFRCMQDVFAAALSKADKRQVGREGIGEEGAILIETCDNGVRISGMDRNIVVDSVIEAVVVEHGSILVTGSNFNELVRRFPDAELTFSAGDDCVITLQAGGSMYKVKGVPSDTFPQAPAVQKNVSFSLSQRLLRKLISKTACSIATDTARPVMNGALLELKQDYVRMVTIDGFRLSMYTEHVEQPVTEEELSVIVPGKTLQDLMKITDDSERMLNINVDGKYITFEDVFTKITGRLIDGEFIKYQMVLPKECRTTVRLNRNDVFRASERAFVLNEKNIGGKLKFSVEKGRIVITVNSSKGSGQEVIECEVAGSPLVFALNGSYLLDALRALDEDSFIMELVTPTNPIVIKPEKSEGSLYLILPVKTE